MKNLFTFFLLALICHAGFSQFPAGMPKPLFASKTDSAGYYSILNETNKIRRSPARQQGIKDPKSDRSLDSLRKLEAKYADKIIGYWVAYRADKKFTSYEEVRNGSAKPELVTQLSIADSKLKSLPPEVYRCTNLQELELVNTTIGKLPARLNKLVKLRRVYIYNNKISGRLKLRRNKQIEALLIRGVRSENLPRTYKRFSALDTLDLSRNIGLTTFPDIYKNEELRKLNLFENYLTLEDLKPIQNQSLQELNLIRNRIKEVPDALASFTGLKKLGLSYNRISAVTPRLSKLTNLESLSFYGNKLESVPSAIYDMPNLKEVDLYFNQIKTLEPGITKLQNLRTLYLSNNKLTELPGNIGELSNLQAFYLHHNRLTDLPESMRQMKSLRILRINDNQFTLFPAPVLALNNLENLDVSQNLLQEFPTELAGLTKLQILVLSGNPWENRADLRRTAATLETTGTIVHGK